MNEKLLRDWLTKNLCYPAKLKDVVNLNISHNYYQDIPDLSLLVNLETIDLSHNSLSELPKLPISVKTVYIESNEISKLDIPSHVKEIYAEDNPVNKIVMREGLEKIYCSRANLPIVEIPRTLDEFHFINCNINHVVLHQDLNYCNLEGNPLEVETHQEGTITLYDYYELDYKIKEDSLLKNI